MKNSEHETDRVAIDSAAAAIARYLNDHPNSGDTLEGVIEWWLARQRERDSVITVSGALDQLIANGTVDKTEYSGGRVLYSLAPATTDQGEFG